LRKDLAFSDAENLRLNEELKQYFRPEFLNRLDNHVFQQLTKMKSNKLILLREVFNRLTEKGITVKSLLGL